MIYVELWELGASGPQRAGTVAWDGRGWIVDPPDQADNWLKPIPTPGGVVTADAPGDFLVALSRHYTGSYFWATPPKEGSPSGPATGGRDANAGPPPGVPGPRGRTPADPRSFGTPPT